MSVAVHARGRQASLARRHLAQQARRCFGSRSPIARSASPVAAEAEFGGEAGGEKGCCGKGTRQDAPSARAPARSLYPVIERSFSGPLLARQDLLPCMFGVGDASRRAHSVVARGARGPGLVPAVATRVRLRSRPGIAVNLQAPWAAGTPERNASGGSSPKRSPHAPRLGRKATLPVPRVRDAIQGLYREEPGFPWGSTGCARRGLGSGFDGSGRGVSSWRGFASVSSSSEPEPYLRYIHRVKTEDSEDSAGGSINGGSQVSPTGSRVNATRSRSEEADARWIGDADSPFSRPKSSSRFVAVTERNAPREGADKDEEGHSMSEKKLAPKWLKAFTAEDILRDKNLLRQQLEVPGNCTVDDAITCFVNERVTSFVVVNRRKEVIGMFTSRDLLGEMAKHPTKADGLKSKAHQFMIPLSQMIYCSPKDSLYQCMLVMSELKVRNLPVVSEGKVMGIVNVNDINDFSFSMEELGGKKAYMENISQRKGLPKGMSLDSRQSRPSLRQAFTASVGAVALPHPYKMPDGSVSAASREHRHREIAEDPALSEDAHFVLDIAWPTAANDTVQYVGIADGVGSWRRVGVDPRQFSLRLMHWAREYILSMSPENGMDPRVSPAPPKPHQVLSAAWEYTIGEKVVGSSTACVAALDYDLQQLTFSNIGDCGVVVLRHIDSDVAGYMREKKTPRHLRDSDLRLAFISQQQLRSFNLPYQFGYTNVPEDNANFETPRDAVNTSFPVRPGDIILLATDGLFDNMELDDICSLTLQWEYKWFGGPMEDLSEHNNAAMDDLARQLGQRINKRFPSPVGINFDPADPTWARELSLDNTRDSPFALLAKENDIMWGGGMPDDITVVAIRAIDKAQSSADVGCSLEGVFGCPIVLPLRATRTGIDYRQAVSKRGVGLDDQHVDEAA